LRYAVNQANASGFGVIVFDESSPDFATGADIVLNPLYSTLVLNDGVQVNIFGLSDGRTSFVSADGFTTMQLGNTLSLATEITISYLDLRGNATNVLINNVTMQTSNLSVTAYNVGTLAPDYTPIQNNGSLTINNGSGTYGYLTIDGAADGNQFIYDHDLNTDVALRYVGRNGAQFNPGVEFSTGTTGVWNVELTNGANVALNTAKTVNNQLLVDATSQLHVDENLTVKADVNVADGGVIDLAANKTLTLNGANNELGSVSDFNAGAGSTVVYDANIAQLVDTVNYANLTFNGSGVKTATSGFIVNETLTVNAGSELVLDYTLDADTLRVNGDTAVNGKLTFADVGTLALYGDNNNLGTFTYGQSTVAYLGGTNQTVSDVDYYNLEIGGGVEKKAVDFDMVVNNNFIIDDNTTFRWLPTLC
jgi:hypothetical protein